MMATTNPKCPGTQNVNINVDVYYVNICISLKKIRHDDDDNIWWLMINGSSLVKYLITCNMKKDKYKAYI